MKQLSIDFNPDIFSQYESCREFIADDDVPRLCRNPRILKKSIAADMDYSPSHFSMKLSGAGDHRFRACQEVGVKPEFVEYGGSELRVRFEGFLV